MKPPAEAASGKWSVLDQAGLIPPTDVELVLIKGSAPTKSGADKGKGMHTTWAEGSMQKWGVLKVKKMGHAACMQHRACSLCVTRIQIQAVELLFGGTFYKRKGNELDAEQNRD